SARYVLYHAGDLTLLTGIFPLFALLVLFLTGLVHGERSPAVRAYLAVAISVSFWTVLQVGIFASREVHGLAERNLIALAPLLFVGFAVWLARDGPRSYATVSTAGVLAAAFLLSLPLKRLVGEA